MLAQGKKSDRHAQVSFQSLDLANLLLISQHYLELCLKQSVQRWSEEGLISCMVALATTTTTILNSFDYGFISLLLKTNRAAAGCSSRCSCANAGPLRIRQHPPSNPVAMIGYNGNWYVNALIYASPERPFKLSFIKHHHNSLK
jgi:hypothetical protein